MSYGAGRGINVSQYLRNLNVQESPVEETLITDEDLAKDLALFTNTQFYDFETGQHTDYQAPPVKPEATQASPTEDAAADATMVGDFPPNFDFMSGDFSFGDYSSTYTSPTVQAFPDGLGNHLQPIQPNGQSAYPAPPSSVGRHPHQQHHHQPQQQSHHGSHHPAAGGYAPPPAPPSSSSAATDKRRASESISPPNGRVLSFEEASRLAAEEDKRKRNTAASARFRIKKKQREQALEKSAKEMTEKVTMLEGRISALETENKWLKSLVTEKHGGGRGDDILEKLLKEFAANGGSVPSGSGAGLEGGAKKEKGAGVVDEVRDSIHAAGDERSLRRKD